MLDIISGQINPLCCFLNTAGNTGNTIRHWTLSNEIPEMSELDFRPIRFS